MNEEKSKIIAELADCVRSDLPVRRGRIPDSSLRHRPRQRGQGGRTAAQAGGKPRNPRSRPQSVSPYDHQPGAGLGRTET